MIEIPALPSGLVLEPHERADSARAEAMRRARAGAEEGTLVLVECPAAPAARHGRAWQLPEGPGLHAALILRPGLPAAECAELGPATLVALGSAISGVVQPMTELHFRWPNDLLLNGGKAAGVWLDGAGSVDALDWLVITWAINTEAAPGVFGHAAAAVGVEGGIGAVDHGELLRSIARELLAEITAWDESGFERILRRWRTRVAVDCGFRAILHGGERVEGTLAAIDDTGALVLRERGAADPLSLNAFFGLPQEVA